MSGAGSLREALRENAKVLADVLTLLRFLVALVIVFCALSANPGLLPGVIILVLAGWTTDVIDGNLARADRAGRKSWVGDHEFLADVALMYSSLLYFMSAGYLPFLPYFLYMLYAAAVAAVWMNMSYVMAVSAPVAASAPIMAFVHARPLGWVFLGWLALHLLCNWQRFRREVADFIRGVERPRS